MSRNPARRGSDGFDGRTLAAFTIAFFALPAWVFALSVADVSVPPIVRIGAYWAVAAIVVGIALFGEELSPPEIGFRRPAWIDLGYVVVTSALILAVFGMTDPLVEALGLPVADEAASLGGDAGLGMMVALAVTIGIVEEILYRGYPLERLLSLTDSSLVAGGLTWGLFTIAHAVSWPLGNLLQVGLVAAVLTVVYLRRRTLVPVVGAHVLVWVLAAIGQAYG